MVQCVATERSTALSNHRPQILSADNCKTPLEAVCDRRDAARTLEPRINNGSCLFEDLSSKLKKMIEGCAKRPSFQSFSLRAFTKERRGNIQLMNYM
ncbi:hypothetical protein MTO96_036316 [Rhipicephalus appendiculatus]